MFGLCLPELKIILRYFLRRVPKLEQKSALYQLYVNAVPLTIMLICVEKLAFKNLRKALLKNLEGKGKHLVFTFLVIYRGAMIDDSPIENACS